MSRTTTWKPGKLNSKIPGTQLFDLFHLHVIDLELGLSGAQLPSAPPKEFLQSFRPDTFPPIPFTTPLHQHASPVRETPEPILCHCDRPLTSTSYLILLSRQGKVVGSSPTQLTTATDSPFSASPSGLPPSPPRRKQRSSKMSPS